MFDWEALQEEGGGKEEKRVTIARIRLDLAVWQEVPLFPMQSNALESD